MNFQIVIFGSQRESIVEFFEKSNLAFKHLFLENWDPAYETMPYPPATGQYAIYDLSSLYSHLNYAMEQVSFMSHCTENCYKYWYAPTAKKESDL